MLTVPRENTIDKELHYCLIPDCQEVVPMTNQGVEMACSDTEGANTEKCDRPARGTGALHTGLQRPLGDQVMTAAAATLSLVPGRWAQLSTGGPACTAGTLLQGCAASCASSATAAPQEEALTTASLANTRLWQVMGTACKR